MIPQADYAFTREEYVIAPVVGTMVDGSLLHLPATEVGDSAPYMAESRCGVNGIVYVRGGAFAGRPVCENCQNTTVKPTTYRDDNGNWVAGRIACPGCGGPMAKHAQLCRKCRLASQPAAQCGTLSRYSRGCRCDRCRDAMRVYHANRRKSFKAAGGCGTNAMYQRGCRCDRCRAAHASFTREYRRRAA